MFKWFNALVGYIIRVRAAVLFLVQTNHLHFCCVCILEGGFCQLKHNWCLNWIYLRPICFQGNHFKALNHNSVFMSADARTHIFSKAEWTFKSV